MSIGGPNNQIGTTSHVSLSPPLLPPTDRLLSSLTHITLDSPLAGDPPASDSHRQPLAIAVPPLLLTPSSHGFSVTHLAYPY